MFPGSPFLSHSPVARSPRKLEMVAQTAGFCPVPHSGQLPLVMHRPEANR